MIHMLQLKKLHADYYAVTALQLFIPLLLLWLTRFLFAFYNADLVGNPSFWRVLTLSGGGLRFDLSAWAYFNVLFIVMRVLPWQFVYNRIYLAISNTIYCITNFVMLAVAIGDIPFFRFSGSRLRLPAVQDMLREDALGGIILSYTGHYWWAFLLGILVLAVLIGVCFIRPTGHLLTLRTRWLTFATRITLMFAALFLTFCAMRGTLGKGRPLSIADAVWYTSTPPETNIVLNSPYCVLRSVEGGSRVPEMNFFSEAEAESIRSSVHKAHKGELIRKNVVVITLESGSQHWIDRLNDVPGGKPWKLMPFLDSLASVSLVNRHMLATGKRSIEGLTAIYGGFPTFGDMLYMSSPYNANRVDSYARLLRDEGYDTRFYFGGNHGSYSIDALAKAMGYNAVIDRDTYNNDADFSGHWGIFDHAMGAYAARDMSALRQPFVTGWFTLDLHEPFNVPSEWNAKGYRNAEKGVLRSAEYTDRAMRHFFEIARTQPWYNNTIFIITGDHGTRDMKGTVYDGLYIQPHVMCMIYAPDGSIAPGEIIDRPMSQFDIGPTILSLLNYPKDYVALGSDMTDVTAPHYAIGFFNGQYQITGNQYHILLTENARAIDKVYDITADPLLKSPLAPPYPPETEKMLRWAEAFLQDYTHRLNSDSLHI